jgi:outer membrane lipoprotein carrier protein
MRATSLSLSTLSRPLLRAALLALAIAAPLGAQAAGAVEQLRAFARDTQSAAGSFSQQTRASTGRAQPAQSGQFAFQRPGKFDWRVIKPYEQRIVSDGRELFQFDPDLNQVSVRKTDAAVGASPAAILFGSGDLEKSFNVKELPARDGMEWLEAVPRTADAGFSKVEIGFAEGLPARLDLFDSFGQSTRVTLSNILRNPSIPADTFTFTAPAGVDVVRMGNN